MAAGIMYPKMGCPIRPICCANGISISDLSAQWLAVSALFVLVVINPGTYQSQKRENVGYAHTNYYG